MRQSTQFLSILVAESEHLVTVSVQLPPDAKAAFERRLSNAFTSEQYGENAQAWNGERLRIIQETIDQHLIPTGVKWVREWLREEEEEYYCKQCASVLRDVSFKSQSFNARFLMFYSVWMLHHIALPICNLAKLPLF